MTLNEMIYHRKSCRSFTNVPVDAATIETIKYVKGFRLIDKVLYEGEAYFVWGRRTSGYFALRKLDGTVVHASASWKKDQIT